MASPRLVSRLEMLVAVGPPTLGRNIAPIARALCDRHGGRALQSTPQHRVAKERKRVAKIPADCTKDEAGFGLRHLKIAGRVTISRFLRYRQPP